MDLSRFDSFATTLSRALSRRAALRGLGGGGLAAGLLGAVGLERVNAASQMTPTAVTVTWQTLHLEFEIMPQAPVSIVRAGSGPPQRGDHFYNDAPIFATGDAGGTRIGTYECFGTWTHASTEKGAHDNRLTTVQYQFDDGSLAGLINENSAGGYDGQRGLGSWRNRRLPRRVWEPSRRPSSPPAPPASPTAGGTPAAAPAVQRATFDLLLPKMG